MATVSLSLGGLDCCGGYVGRGMWVVQRHPLQPELTPDILLNVFLAIAVDNLASGDTGTTKDKGR